MVDDKKRHRVRDGQWVHPKMTSHKTWSNFVNAQRCTVSKFLVKMHERMIGEDLRELGFVASVVRASGVNSIAVLLVGCRASVDKPILECRGITVHLKRKFFLF
jgi:hypothetical protein